MIDGQKAHRASVYDTTTRTNDVVMDTDDEITDSNGLKLLMKLNKVKVIEKFIATIFLLKPVSIFPKRGFCSFYKESRSSTPASRLEQLLLK